jgi:hypothetical protein
MHVFVKGNRLGNAICKGFYFKFKIQIVHYGVVIRVDVILLEYVCPRDWHPYSYRHLYYLLLNAIYTIKMIINQAIHLVSWNVYRNISEGWGVCGLGWGWGEGEGGVINIQKTLIGPAGTTHSRRAWLGGTEAAIRLSTSRNLAQLSEKLKLFRCRGWNTFLPGGGGIYLVSRINVRCKP